MDFAWDPKALEPVLVLGLVTVAYVVYHYLGSPDVLRRFVGGTGDDAQARSVYASRVAGFVVLGPVCAGVAMLCLPTPLVELGVGLTDPVLALGEVVGLMILLAPILYLGARNPRQWKHYPPVRRSRWGRGDLLANAASWALYLLAYEFFFRGLLLFTLVDWVGVWPAIAITTALYVYAHLPKFGGETAGTIPMGVVFALMALSTGGFWAPFVAHVLIAVVSDYFNCRHNPEITLS
jgi:membrane protease YdiL (CAAX protease family)